jgi:hypothetical protein
MKAILPCVLSVLVTGAFSLPPATAEPTAYDVQPVTLVHLGYQGYFAKQGIPGGLAFLLDSQSGKVTPVTLIRGAIETKRLPPEALENTNYLNGVRNALQENIDHG